MSHRTKEEQLAFKVRKGNNAKVRSTKIHKPRPAYNRKKSRIDIENYLAQGTGEKA